MDGEKGRELAKGRSVLLGSGWAESDAADKATNSGLVFLNCVGEEWGQGLKRGLFFGEELGAWLPVFPLTWLLRNLGGMVG